MCLYILYIFAEKPIRRYGGLPIFNQNTMKDAGTLNPR